VIPCDSQSGTAGDPAVRRKRRIPQTCRAGRAPSLSRRIKLARTTRRRRRSAVQDDSR
jgi:hypothetical protein